MTYTKDIKQPTLPREVPFVPDDDEDEPRSTEWWKDARIMNPE